MTIHHAIVKKAAAAGVLLATEDATVSARHVATNTTAYADIADHESENEAAREAWDTAQNIADWNIEQTDGLAIWQDPEDLTFAVMLRQTGEDGEPTDEPVEVGFTTWADAKEAAEAVDTGEAVEEDEGEEDTGSVVPMGFKQLYREIGVRGQDNGDELAHVFATHTIITDGKKDVIDAEKVEALASRNGVEYPLDGYGPANTGTRGWEGRYRMTVGNMLRKRIADAGEIVIPASLNNGEEKTLPLSVTFCDKHRTKPKMSKKAKAEAAKALADLTAEAE